MNFIIKIFKKYYKVASMLSSLIMMLAVIDNVINDILVKINFLYVLRVVLSIIEVTLVLIPFIALLDFMFIQSAKIISKDFREADDSGKVLFIVAFSVLLLKKIYIWTR